MNDKFKKFLIREGFVNEVYMELGDDERRVSIPLTPEQWEEIAEALESYMEMNKIEYDSAQSYEDVLHRIRKAGF